MQKVGFNLKGRMIFFATGNIHKFNEARVVLSEHGLATAMLRMKGAEIQSDNLREIAVFQRAEAFRHSHLPLSRRKTRAYLLMR